MPIRFTIRPQDLGKFEKHLADNYAAIGNKAALSAAMRSVGYMQERTRSAIPANPGGVGTGGAFDRGTYLRGWRARRHPDGAILYNGTLYAGVVEAGRRRGKFPPVAVIRRWVQRRLGVPADRSAGVAFVVARAIAQRGLVGRRIMTAQVARLWMARTFQEEIRREYDRAIAAAARAAQAGQ